ncbi:TPA: hypothetical protein MW242_002637 [Acinetobacter baumannii]|nr:hypothetical protein [Acinetobacter baumannii]
MKPVKSKIKQGIALLLGSALIGFIAAFLILLIPYGFLSYGKIEFNFFNDVFFIVWSIAAAITLLKMVDEFGLLRQD